MMIKPKVAIRTVQDRLNLQSYSKSRKYKFTYEAKVCNSTNEEKKCTLILPIPLDTRYQKIEGLSINPSPKKQETDKLHNNHYAIWNIELSKKEEKSFVITYTAKIKPRQNKPKKLTLSDYKLEEDEKKYIKPNKYVKSEDERVKKLAKEIIGEQQDVYTIAKLLNEYVIKNLKYGNPIDGLHSSDSALNDECTDCGGYDTFLIALLRSVGIPARIVSGFWAGHDDIKNAMHAWMELMLPDKTWIPADPASQQLFKQGRMWVSGRLGYTGSDRIAMSIGEEIPLKNGDEEISTDILQNPILLCKNNSGVSVKLNFDAKSL